MLNFQIQCKLMNSQEKLKSQSICSMKMQMMQVSLMMWMFSLFSTLMMISRRNWKWMIWYLLISWRMTCVFQNLTIVTRMRMFCGVVRRRCSVYQRSSCHRLHQLSPGWNISIELNYDPINTAQSIRTMFPKSLKLYEFVICSMLCLYYGYTCWHIFIIAYKCFLF